MRRNSADAADKDSVKDEDLPPVAINQFSPADDEVVGKKRRMKRNIVDDEEDGGSSPSD